MKHRKTILIEGGNLSVRGHNANPIDLNQVDRSKTVEQLTRLFRSINKTYESLHNRPLWDSQVFDSQNFLSGSSRHFFNLTQIPDGDFKAVKPKVGDIDVMIDRRKQAELADLFNRAIDRQVGPAVFLGFKKGNQQFSTLWNFPKSNLNVQIDFEFVEFDKNGPTDWSIFSHSSAWRDMNAGIKGVFHKYLVQALTALSKKQFLLRKMAGRGSSRAELDKPTIDNQFSFAVSAKAGGGLRAKYTPVIDAQTGKPMIKHGMMVMNRAPAGDYEQDIVKIFTKLLPELNEDQAEKVKTMFWSFTGLINLLNKVLSPDKKKQIADAFLAKTIDTGAQGLYKNDPQRDIKEKIPAIRTLFQGLGLELPDDFEQRVQAYQTNYRMASKLQESVVPTKKQSITHLEKMSAKAFLEFLDSIKTEKGWEIRSMPITVKIDGIGGRFGKDKQGKPFFESSKSGPIQTRNAFSQYVASKGVTNPITVDRAQKYDKLYDEIMGLISKIDATFGEEFLKDKKIVCEMLYLPMAEKVGNRYRFINMAYDIPKGINLVVVPLHVVRSSNGKISAKSRIIVDKLCNLKRIDDVLFLNNRAKLPRSIDLTVALQAVDLNDVRTMLASKDKADKEQAAQLLLSVKNKIAEILINSSDISGKDILGTEFEGIILHTKSGPIKITSPAMKAAMQQKQQSAAPSGPKSGKIALITAGSFVGHKGHQQLVDLALQKAAEIGADPYVYITSTVGPDDPIEPRVKLKTWQNLYPQHKNIFQLVRPDGTIGKKIEKELITSSNPPPYDHIVMMVGNDRSEGFQNLMNHLSRRLKNPKYPGFDHVKFTVIGTPRDQESGGTGITFTDLRNVLKDQNLTSEDKLNRWINAFDVEKLGSKYIEKLMKLTSKGMNIMNKQKLKEFVASVKSAIPNATPEQRRKLIELMENVKRDLDAPPPEGDRRKNPDLFPKDIDSEYRMTIDFARQHYPMAKTDEEAFAKFVLRSLKHSKEDSEDTKIRMEEIVQRLDKLEAQIKKVGMRKTDVTESGDYTEEK